MTAAEPQVHHVDFVVDDRGVQQLCSCGWWGQRRSVLVGATRVLKAEEREHLESVREPEPPTPRPWPEDSIPTADELDAWLEMARDDERLDLLGRLLEGVEVASRCVQADHDGLGHQLQRITEESAAHIARQLEDPLRARLWWTEAGLVKVPGARARMHDATQRATWWVDGTHPFGNAAELAENLQEASAAERAVALALQTRLVDGQLS